MRLSRRTAPDGVAEALFFGDATGEIEAVHVTWRGEEDALLRLPSVAFDEHLAFARFDKDGLNSLAETERRLEIAHSSGVDGDDWLWKPGLLVEVPPTAKADAVLTTEVRMEEGQQRLWARSTEHPKEARPVIHTIGYLVYWDWVFGGLRAERPDVLPSLLESLVWQCAYYREHGLPNDVSLRKMGKAVYFAAIRTETGLDRDEWMDMSEDERTNFLELKQEIRVLDAEREHTAQDLEHDLEFQGKLDSLIVGWNDLWGSDANPLKRPASGEPGDVELAIIKYSSFATSMSQLVSAATRAREGDMTPVCRAMAGGYLWREAEQEAANSATPLLAIMQAVEIDNQSPLSGLGVFDGSRAGRMARAVSIALPSEAASALAFSLMARDEYSGILLEAGSNLIVDFVYRLEEAPANAMLPDSGDLRAAFVAGVALREIEPYFPPDGVS